MRKCVSAVALLSLAVTLCYGGLRTIHTSKAEYKPRANSAWKSKGRIVGPMARCPGCKIEVTDANGKAVKTLDVAKDAGAFEVEWLNPGVYNLKMTADGYHPLIMLELEVRARNDLWIEIEF